MGIKSKKKNEAWRKGEALRENKKLKKREKRKEMGKHANSAILSIFIKKSLPK